MMNQLLTARPAITVEPQISAEKQGINPCTAHTSETSSVIAAVIIWSNLQMLKSQFSVIHHIESTRAINETANTTHPQPPAPLGSQIK